MFKRILAIAALTVTPAAGSVVALTAPGTALAATSIASIVLKPADVPTGFRLTQGKAETAQSEAKSAKVSVATLRAQGWLGTYNETFDKGNNTTDTQIYSGAGQFKSVGGANWNITNGENIVKKQLTHIKTFSISGIGQNCVGLTASGTLQKVKYAALYVVFRHGTYVGLAAEVYLGKFSGVPSVAQVEHLATIMNGRIK